MLQRVKYNFLSRGRVKRRVNYEQSTLGRGDKTGRVSLRGHYTLETRVYSALRPRICVL